MLRALGLVASGFSKDSGGANAKATSAPAMPLSVRRAAHAWPLIHGAFVLAIVALHWFGWLLLGHLG